MKLFTKEKLDTLVSQELSLKQLKAELKGLDLTKQISDTESSIKAIKNEILELNNDISSDTVNSAATDNYVFEVKVIVKDKTTYDYESFINVLKDANQDTTAFTKVILDEDKIKAFIDANIEKNPALAKYKHVELSKSVNINGIKTIGAK